ncbi:MAG TPA: TetR/AcrR family transcriptional regulator [Pseudonocardia sp.]
MTSAAARPRGRPRKDRAGTAPNDPPGHQTGDRAHGSAAGPTDRPVDSSTGDPVHGSTPSTDQLLSVALDAFATYGYQGVSVRTLNRELGVSHNLLHQRFGSKQAIWYAAVDHGFGRLTAELARATAEQDDPLAQLRAFITAFVAFSARHPQLYRLVNQESSQHTERLDYLLDRYVRPTIGRMAPIYEELVEHGRIRALSWEAVYHLITAGGAAKYGADALSTALFSADALAADGMDSYADCIASLIIDGLRTP